MAAPATAGTGAAWTRGLRLAATARRVRALREALSHRLRLVADVARLAEPLAAPWREALARCQGAARRVAADERWARRTLAAGGRAARLLAPLPPAVDDAPASPTTAVARWREAPPRAAARPPADPALKALWRRLARRFHPDRAGSHGAALMCEVNRLLGAGDMGGLLALDHGGDAPARSRRVPADDDDDDRDLDALAASEREGEAQYRALRGVPAYGMWQRVARGEQLAAVVAAIWQPRVAAARAHLLAAIAHLEAAVGPPQERRLAVAAPAPALDPLSGSQAHVAIADELAAAPVGPALAVLMAYAAGRAPDALVGLEQATAWDARLQAASAALGTPSALAEALGEGEAWVGWGLRRAAAGHGYCAPVLRPPMTGEAVAQALQEPAVERLWVALLEVLGEQETCSGCGRQAWLVPLFRLRGLDDLRALVCPLCGSRQRSYWLPRGHDVQAALGPDYLAHQVVLEAHVLLPMGEVSLQLVPQEVADQRLEDLVARLEADVFGRSKLAVPGGKLTLAQGGRPLAAHTPLEALVGLDFEVRADRSTEAAWAAAAEVLAPRRRQPTRTEARRRS